MLTRSLKKEYLKKGINIEDENELSNQINNLESVLRQKESLDSEIYPDVIYDLINEIKEGLDYLYENGFCNSKKCVLLKIMLLSSNNNIVKLGFKSLDKVIVDSGDIEYEERQEMIKLIKEIKDLTVELNGYKDDSIRSFIDCSKMELELEKLKIYKNKKGK